MQGFFFLLRISLAHHQTSALLHWACKSFNFENMVISCDPKSDIFELDLQKTKFKGNIYWWWITLYCYFFKRKEKIYFVNSSASPFWWPSSVSIADVSSTTWVMNALASPWRVNMRHARFVSRITGYFTCSPGALCKSEWDTFSTLWDCFRFSLMHLVQVKFHEELLDG